MRNVTARRLRRLSKLTRQIQPDTSPGYYRKLKGEWTRMSLAERRAAGPAIDRTILQFERLVETFGQVKAAARAGKGNQAAATLLREDPA